MGNKIKTMLKEDEEIFHIPSLSFVNGDWNTLVQFLEYEGSPKWSFGEALDLEDNSDVTSLHNLVSVDGFLDLTGTKVTTLGNLKYVGSWLDITETEIETLGDLEYVGDALWGAQVESLTSLGNLKKVNSSLDLEGCINLKTLGKLTVVGSWIDLKGCKNLESLGDLEECHHYIDVVKTKIPSRYTYNYLVSIVNGGTVYYNR